MYAYCPKGQKKMLTVSPSSRKDMYLFKEWKNLEEFHGSFASLQIWVISLCSSPVRPRRQIGNGNRLGIREFYVL